MSLAKSMQAAADLHNVAAEQLYPVADWVAAYDREHGFLVEEAIEEHWGSAASLRRRAAEEDQ